MYIGLLMLQQEIIDVDTHGATIADSENYIVSKSQHLSCSRMMEHSIAL
jgi:hypothetical protein